MSTPAPPPLLLSAALGVWGWQTGQWGFFLVLAPTLEAAHWVRWRWSLSDQDFNRLIDFTAVLLLAAMGYQFTQYLTHGVLREHLFVLVSWLPVLLYPLVAVQRYAKASGVKLKSLFYSLRHTPSDQGERRVDLVYPYVLLCILAASMTTRTGYAYGAAFVVLYLLWSVNRGRRPAWRWGLLAVAACGVSILLMPGLHRLQLVLEAYAAEWFTEHWLDRDPYRAITALGDVGELKGSERILLRVRPEHPLPAGGLLLRQASYNTFFGTTWRAKLAPFTEHAPQEDYRSWHFGETSALKGTRVIIGAPLSRGKAVLPLPLGTVQLKKLPVGSLQRNILGTVRVTEGPGLAHYVAEYAAATPLDSTPREADLALSRTEQAIVEALATDLGLEQMPGAQAVAALERFFSAQFTYTLELPTAPDPKLTAIGNFLRHTRTGHCEYFATATVLLLRAAGIPARYASGYAVREHSPITGVYVVRGRHAHAWTLAYVDGSWRDVDTTPTTWLAYEENRTPWWQTLSDAWDWLTYAIARWRWQSAGQGTEQHNTPLLAMLGALVSVLAWRLARQRRIRQARPIEKEQPVHGHDSPLFQVLRTLEAQGLVRPPGESLRSFLQRLRLLETPDMTTIVNLHNRHRFDPQALTAKEWSELNSAVESWQKKRNPRNGS